MTREELRNNGSGPKMEHAGTTGQGSGIAEHLLRVVVIYNLISQ